jgi:hypothetical protein
MRKEVVWEWIESSNLRSRREPLKSLSRPIKR